MINYNCSICNSLTTKLSKIFKFTENSKFDWEHDSTMKLLRLREVEVQVRICLNCFHFIIFPKFDASVLYGKEGPQIRKKIYESYFPNKIYGQKRHELILKEDFSRLSRDFLRFYQTTQFISKNAQSSFMVEKEIRILDWGGGDGYISSTYSKLLNTITGHHVTNFIYDYTDWGNLEINKVGLNDLKKMEPFHIIIFSHVLEHSHNPILDLKLGNSFLIDQGIVICEVPDERAWTTVRIIKRIKLGLHYHVHSFTRRSLHKLLECSDFKSIATEYQYKSSYRGERMHSIIGIAQKEKFHFAEKQPSFIYECASLIKTISFAVVLKIFTKLKIVLQLK
jgi:hypothetical protein